MAKQTNKDQLIDRIHHLSPAQFELIIQLLDTIDTTSVHETGNKDSVDKSESMEEVSPQLLDRQLELEKLTKQTEKLFEKVDEEKPNLTARGTPRIKRTYRKANERPRPDLSAKHDANQIDAHFQSRINRNISDLIEQFRKKSGMTKKEITEQALLKFLEENGFEL